MVEINDAEMETLIVSEELRQRFQPILDVLRTQAARLTSLPDVVRVRPGFQHSSAGVVPALILGVLPPLSDRLQRDATELARHLNIAVAVEEAPPQDQLAYYAIGTVELRSDFRDLLEPPPVPFRAPVRGQYEPPSGPGAPRLAAVEEPMKLTLSTSPDSGWPVLRDFLAKGVRKSLHVGMYQFTAPHIYKTLRRTMLDDDDAVLTMTIHPRPENIPEEGTKANDIFGPTILGRLANALGGRFQHALTTLGQSGEFASAYHIKVAVVDQKRLWLSSGNWQSSNQPPFDPFADEELPSGYHRKYNREHHVVIENAALAKTFAGFLEYDFTRAGEAPAEFAPAAPDLMVAFEPEIVDFAPPRYFRPLTLDGTIRVEPLLTPDNYAQAVYDLIKGAQQRVWVQNQYINLNPQEDFLEFTKIVHALLKKVEAGLDVRIICRNLMDAEKLDMLLAIGFPRDIFRFMAATHTKVFIVDNDRVLIGSHNLSNEGVVSNRDASVIIHHQGAVEFCADVFDYDWHNRANARPQRSRPRVARPGEQPAPGSFRVNWSSVYDEPPRPIAAVTGPRAGQPTKPTGTGGRVQDAGHGPERVSFDIGGAPPDEDVLYINGIDATTGETLLPPVRIAVLAESLRRTAATIPVEVRRSAEAATVRSFGLPDSINRDDIRRTGWGVVVPEGRDDLFERIRPLWDHRAKTVPADRLKRLSYQPGEGCRQWLRRHGVTWGTQLPTAVPHHVLLLGPPTDISFEFQYLLDLEYSVGRLSFNNDADWPRYCEAVAKTEREGSPCTRKISWFAPRHDGATMLSHDELVMPLTKEDPSGLTSLSGYESVPLLGHNATRAQLLEAMNDIKPALLFTASHGVGLDLGDPQQAALQGALLTADWHGGPVSADSYLAAQHITADVRGMMAFIFACFGAGTPQVDDYPDNLALPRKQLATQPFVAALPQALLASGALAVVGHVDRAWGCSIRPAGLRNQLGPFRNMLDRILRGCCVGNATCDFSERSAVLSQELLDMMTPGGSTAVDDESLVWSWLERNDARAYVLLGDPAVRLEQM